MQAQRYDKKADKNVPILSADELTKGDTIWMDKDEYKGRDDKDIINLINNKIATRGLVVVLSASKEYKTANGKRYRTFIGDLDYQRAEFTV